MMEQSFWMKARALEEGELVKRTGHKCCKGPKCGKVCVFGAKLQKKSSENIYFCENYLSLMVNV